MSAVDHALRLINHYLDEDGENAQDLFDAIKCLKSAEHEEDRLGADRELLLAIRFFYGNHQLNDEEQCESCAHWVEDFRRMIRYYDAMKDETHK